MASAPWKLCSWPGGCPVRVHHGRCEEHRKSQRRRDARYQQGLTRYNNPDWVRYATSYRAEHPFCINKGTEPLCTLVTDVVDHIVPHRGDEQRFWDPLNHQPMCYGCHGRKTAQETLTPARTI